MVKKVVEQIQKLVYPSIFRRRAAVRVNALYNTSNICGVLEKFHIGLSQAT